MRAALALSVACLAACRPAVDIEGVLYQPPPARPPPLRRDAAVTSTRTSSTPMDADAGVIDAGDPRCPEPTLASIHDKILLGTCAAVGCHAGAQPAESLAFDRTLLDVASRLRQPAAQSPSRMPLVTPGQPGASYLYLKVYLDTPLSGDPMPPTGKLLPCELTALRRWIEAGAP